LTKILMESGYHKIFVLEIIAEFVESMAEIDSQKECLDQFMPVLVDLFCKCNVSEGYFVTLFESISKILTNVRSNFLPYLEPIMARVISMSKEITVILNQVRM
jgi:1,2-phenylacetyl-CoA epoxidase catalytic subunit